MKAVVVREHARLTTGHVSQGSMAEASIPASAFDWLCRESKRLLTKGAALVQVEDRTWLRLDNYVGVIETPCGTRIEILPKHVDDEDDPAAARDVFLRMLRRCLDLPARDMGPTALQTVDMPVSEWIIQQFLIELDLLVRRGVRFDYRAVEEEVRFLRGRLVVARQMRQSPARSDRLHVEHHVFDANRAENRLLRSAVDKAAGLARDPDNWRLGHELAHQLAEVPASRDVQADFRSWRSDRLMAHYQSIRAWCGLILGERNPLSMLGDWTGRSLLFPMEKVYERYVHACLKAHLPLGARVLPQQGRHYLCMHGQNRMFQLQPDFVVEHEGQRWVVDAKWKLLDAADREGKYGLRQSDFYQLYAYGQRYLGGSGRMALIYPRTKAFEGSLDLFSFDDQDQLQLEVIPLDLKSGRWSGNCLPLAREPH